MLAGNDSCVLAWGCTGTSPIRLSFPAERHDSVARGREPNFGERASPNSWVPFPRIALRCSPGMTAGLRRWRPEHVVDFAASRSPASPDGRSPARRRWRGGMCAERGQEVLVDRVAFAVDALLLVHLRLRSARAVRPDRSVRRSHWRVRRRRHRARSVRPRADRARVARASAASQRGYSQRIVGRSMPRFGSTRATRIFEKMSAQLSLSATSMPAAARLGRKDVAVALAAVGQGREQIDAGVMRERVGDGQPLGFGARIAGSVAIARIAHAAVSAAEPQQLPDSRPAPMRRARARDTIRAS